MTETRNPSFGSVLREVLDARLEDVHVSIPGRVTSYDAAKCRADVQPLIRGRYTDEDGARQSERLPVLTEVPVIFPGANGFRVTFPVVAGDTVLLVFSEASLDAWLSAGGEVDPADDRRFALADAVAIPGLKDFGHVAAASSSEMVIGKDEGARVRIDGETVSVDDGSGAVALATKADVDALANLLTTWTVAPGDGGLALKTAALALVAGPPSWPSGTSVLKGK